MPDKAIDLVDEAASRLRMEVDSKPEEIDEIDRKIIQLKIEQSALKKEKDKASPWGPCSVWWPAVYVIWEAGLVGV